MPDYQPRPNRDVVYFNGSAINDTSFISKGTGTRITSITGWEGAADIRDDRESKTGRDGENADQAFLGGRTISIDGVVHGSTWEDLQDRKRDLAAILAHSTTEALLKVPNVESSVESSLYEYAMDLSPVAYWRLGEAAGSSTADNAQGTATYDGTYTGPTAGITGAVSGDEDTCADFDGSNDFVTIPFNSALNPAAFTVAAWVYVDGGAGTIRTIYDSRNSGATTGFCLRLTAANVAAFGVAEAAGFSEGAGTTAITASAGWYHIAGTYSGGSRTTYVNGVAEAGPTADTYTATTATATRIGYSTASAAPFNGKIDEVMLFNSALTADQILQLYRRASGAVGSNDTSGYERSTARVIDNIVFGEMFGPNGQTFAVSLRASDPRIYSDSTSTASGTTASITNSGRVPTPATIAATLSTFAGETTRTVASGGGQIGIDTDVGASGDIVTIRTPDATADWTTAYHTGRDELFSPVVLYRLNETSGTTAASITGGAFDGTYMNTPTLNQTGHATSIVSASFASASSEYVTVPWNTYVNTPVLTVELWVYFDSVTGTHGIAGVENSGQGWSIYQTGSSVVLQWQSGNASLYFTDTFAISTWYHLVAVLGPAGASVYKNGELDVSTTYQSAGNHFYDPAEAGALTMGRVDSPSVAYLAGRLDNFAIYDRVLSSTEIASLYAASAATATFSNYGARIIEPSCTEWFYLPVGASTLTAKSGISAQTVTYREARM